MTKGTLFPRYRLLQYYLMRNYGESYRYGFLKVENLL